ncbi:MAG TPA: HAMP domain-containing sensor histidine kinase [Longimicrobiales bacterium]
MTEKKTPVDNTGAPAPQPADVLANRYNVLSRLADDLAHEIKNPLNAIVVNLEVLRRRVDNGSQQAALERADVIEHEVRRVHGLVDQLLQMLRPARAEAGPVAVDGILDGLLGAVELQAKAARVELAWQAESSLYAQVRVEPFKFALLNALTYAIDAEAQAGGKVDLQARRAADEIYVIINGSAGKLSAEHEHIRHCRQLMVSAGGALESLEPHANGTGSTLTLVVPTAKFGGTNTIGHNFE